VSVPLPIVDANSISSPSFDGGIGTGSSGADLQTGQGALAVQPAAEKTTGKGIPAGLVIFGAFVALALSGPLLGYARWQLLEGRQR
jgi:hypothetical protein